MAERTATLIARHELTPGVHLFELAVEGEPLVFRAGQFLSLRCGAAGDVRRSYTIVSSPAHGERIDLLVKDVAGGVGTALFAGLTPGASIAFTGPMGFFVAEASHPGDAVHVVTGAGIAAALPIIEETLARPAETGAVHLLWGQPQSQPRYFEDRLAQLASQPRFRRSDVTGADWLTVHEALGARTQAILPDLQAPVFYLVGNGDMCRRIRDLLVAAGLDRRKQIKNELFYPVMEGQK